MSDLMDNEVKTPEEFTTNDESTTTTYNTMKCLSLDGLKTTISSYILIGITLYFLFSIIFFIKCGFHKLKNDINKIIINKEKDDIKKLNNQITQGTNMIFSRKIKNKNSPPQKLKLRFLTHENHGKRYHRVLRSDSSGLSSFKKLNLYNNIIQKEDRNKNIQKMNLRNNSSKDTKDYLQNLYIKYNFSDYELNIMIYQDAVIFDRRSCCKYYISLLKAKHPLIFSFCPFKDYNSIIIKSCIFFLSFTFYFFSNFMFFNEDVIHQIYEDKGKYNIIYFLPKISISFAISHLMTIIIKYIFLSESNIIEIKMKKSLILAHAHTFKVTKKLRTKYILFFLFGFIFLIICWIFLSSFGVVYKNTELILLKNTLICILISFIYPIFINIFPSLLRTCSLSTKKHNLRCKYNFSKILQLI